MTTMKQVCTCENCGNEADMVVTCTWIDVEEAPGVTKKKKKETKKCTVCGNEADMIVDE
jgi:transcription elongation factor Elf1